MSLPLRQRRLDDFHFAAHDGVEIVESGRLQRHDEIVAANKTCRAVGPS